MSDYEPKLVCFSCKFGWGYLTDEEKLSSKIKNWIPVICSGRIDTTHVLDAFKQGADGVLILGCPEGDCHFQDGNFEAKRRAYLLQKLLEAYGIERQRLRVELSVDAEGKAIPSFVKKMSDSIAPLGPLWSTDTASATTKARKRK